jgi:hypothetical protein
LVWNLDEGHAESQKMGDIFDMFLCTLTIVSTLAYDVLTGRIKRLYGIARKNKQP